MGYLQLPIAGFLGILAPLLVSYLKQQSWSAEVKSLAALAVSFVFGIFTATVTGSFSLNAVAEMTGVVFTTATVFYQTYFQHTALNTTLEQVTIPPLDNRPL